MNRIEKFKVALRVLRISPEFFFLEARRRIMGKSYQFNGIEISDSSNFGVMYELKKRAKRFQLIVGKNGYYLVDKKWNIKLFSPSFVLLGPILYEDLLDLKAYKLSESEIRNKRVLDVGAYLGETPIAFSLMGAKWVVTYEPVFFNIVRKNLFINRIKNVEVFPCGLWEKDGYRWVKEEAGNTGQHAGELRIKVKSWLSLLKKRSFDLAKVDCEGCERGLLKVPNKILSRIPLWLIAIHGDELALIKKFKNAGFINKMIYSGLEKTFRFEKRKISRKNDR